MQKALFQYKYIKYKKRYILLQTAGAAEAKVAEAKAEKAVAATFAETAIERAIELERAAVAARAAVEAAESNRAMAVPKEEARSQARIAQATAQARAAEERAKDAKSKGASDWRQLAEKAKIAKEQIEDAKHSATIAVLRPEQRIADAKATEEKAIKAAQNARAVALEAEDRDAKAGRNLDGLVAKANADRAERAAIAKVVRDAAIAARIETEKVLAAEIEVAKAVPNSVEKMAAEEKLAQARAAEERAIRLVWAKEAIAAKIAQAASITTAEVKEREEIDDRAAEERWKQASAEKDRLAYLAEEVKYAQGIAAMATDQRKNAEAQFAKASARDKDKAAAQVAAAKVAEEKALTAVKGAKNNERIEAAQFAKQYAARVVEVKPPRRMAGQISKYVDRKAKNENFCDKIRDDRQADLKLFMEEIKKNRFNALRQLNDLMGYDEIHHYPNLSFLDNFGSNFEVNPACLCKMETEYVKLDRDFGRGAVGTAKLISINSGGVSKQYILKEIQNQSIYEPLKLRAIALADQTEPSVIYNLKNCVTVDGKIEKRYLYVQSSNEFVNQTIMHLILNEILNNEIDNYIFQYDAFVCEEEIKGYFLNGVQKSGYNIMEVAQYGDLSNYLTNISSINGTFLLNILRQVLRPLAYLKCKKFGFVHADLKCRNVFVAKGANDQPIYKIADYDKSSIFWKGIRFYLPYITSSGLKKISRMLPESYPILLQQYQENGEQIEGYVLEPSQLALGFAKSIQMYTMYNYRPFYMSYDIYTFIYSLMCEHNVYEAVTAYMINDNKNDVDMNIFLEIWEYLWLVSDFQKIKLELRDKHLKIAQQIHPQIGSAWNYLFGAPTPTSAAAAENEFDDNDNDINDLINNISVNNVESNYDPVIYNNAHKELRSLTYYNKFFIDKKIVLKNDLNYIFNLLGINSINYYDELIDKEDTRSRELYANKPFKLDAYGKIMRGQ